jgi:dTDP-4-dehydrorhamnose reductase
VKLLLLGRNGMLGRALSPILPQLGDLVGWGRDEADFDRPDQLAALIRREEPDFIINAAAYTAVDAAEDDRERAFRVNAEAVGAIAEAARSIAAFVVHYSTDFVFDGASTAPYAETDRPNPLSVYGRSKLAGEAALQQSGAVAMILRVSWTYADQGRNFPLAILNAARSRDSMNVVMDEVGAATSVLTVADATIKALRQIIDNRGLGGLYHVAASGSASRYDLARFLVTEALAAGADLKLRPDAIKPIPASAWPSKVRRPANSVFDTTAFESIFGVHLPPWQDGIRQLIRTLRARGEL